jgi:flagellar biosynthesis/type III secretory pathway protein FliH
LQKHLDDNGFSDAIVKTVFIIGMLFGAVAIPHWTIWWLIWSYAEDYIIEPRIVKERAEVRDFYYKEIEKAREKGYDEGYRDRSRTDQEYLNEAAIIKNNHDNIVRGIEENNTKEIEKLKKDHARQIAALKRSHTAEIEAQRKRYVSILQYSEAYNLGYHDGRRGITRKDFPPDEE